MKPTNKSPDPMVGLVVNPAAGKDIRRIVARGRFISDEEKVNIVARILSGLSAAGVKKVLAMPDTSNITAVAASRGPDDLEVEMLDMVTLNRERDSTLAAEAMIGRGVGCIVTLGGDGTNRSVALAGGDIPIVPVSTGTNNVFPVLVEGTTAGLAAGVVATGSVEADLVTRRAPLLELRVDGELKDVALIDMAISTQLYVGARAVWDMGLIDEVFVSGIYPTSIGLSSIASRLPIESDAGVRVRLGPNGGSNGRGAVVTAPVTPGVFAQVPVEEWALFPFDEPVTVRLAAGTVAVDGERNVVFRPGQAVTVTLVKNGPRVVSIEKALELAGRTGVFVTVRGRAGRGREV